ncbi:MAG: hypothetical protein ACOX9C_06440 [Kiritimatiellia bacterium]
MGEPQAIPLETVVPARTFAFLWLCGSQPPLAGSKAPVPRKVGRTPKT